MGLKRADVFNVLCLWRRSLGFHWSAPFFFSNFIESKHEKYFVLMRYQCCYAYLLLMIVLSGCTQVHNIRLPGKNSGQPRPFTIMTYNIRVGAGLRKYGRSPYLLKDKWVQSHFVANVNDYQIMIVFIIKFCSILYKMSHFGCQST